MDYIKFYRNLWEKAATYKSAAKRALFYDTIFRAAFEGYIPDASDDVPFTAYLMAKPILIKAEHAAKVAQSRRKCVTSDAQVKTDITCDAQVNHSFYKKKGKEKKSTLTGATRTPARCSADLLRETGRKLGVPPEFTAYFAAEMEKLGWRSMKPDGRTYAVTDANVAATLRNWWNVEKKNNPRAPSAVPADVPRGASCADDDATPEWVRSGGAA